MIEISLKLDYILKKMIIMSCCVCVTIHLIIQCFNYNKTLLNKNFKNDDCDWFRISCCRTSFFDIIYFQSVNDYLHDFELTTLFFLKKKCFLNFDFSYSSIFLNLVTFSLFLRFIATIIVQSLFLRFIAIITVQIIVFKLYCSNNSSIVMIELNDVLNIFFFETNRNNIRKIRSMI